MKENDLDSGVFEYGNIFPMPEENKEQTIFEDKPKIEPETEEGVQDNNEDVGANEIYSYEGYKANKVIGAIPLEPCVVFVSVSAKDLNDIKTIGIPGFIDILHKRFFNLNGSLVNLDGFEDKFTEFAIKKVQQMQEEIEEQELRKKATEEDEDI